MSKKFLVAFDFDDTMIAANSDVYIQKLAPNNGHIPETIRQLYSGKNWTNYMGEIFKYLHDNGVSRDQILGCMEEIPLVDGIEELIRFLSDINSDIIVISDSNSVFIEHILKRKGLDSYIQKVYTNPALFNSDGCLTLEYYHTQHWCTMSTVNLCKGQILDDHISESKNAGRTFDSVAYVGDGSNDLCPCMRLKEKQDVVFPRKGFKLISKLASHTDLIEAAIVPWASGHDIIKEFKKRIV